MKRKILLLLTIIVGLLLMVSCTEDDSQPTLSVSVSVSDTSLSFSKASESKEVEVLSDVVWNAIANVDWIKLTVKENLLIVTAEENKGVKARSGEILIYGSVGEKITVTQEGSENNLVVVPESFSVDCDGGLFYFHVESNIENWDVYIDVDWMEVVVEKTALNQVAVKISESKILETRTANILVQSKDKAISREVTVTQEGTPYCILPFLKFGRLPSFREFNDFEFDRGSRLTATPDGERRNYWVYTPKGTGFDLIMYHGTVLFDVDLLGVYMIPSQQLVENIDDYIAFLKENGFEETPWSHKSLPVLENKELKVTVECDYNVYGMYAPDPYYLLPCFWFYPTR